MHIETNKQNIPHSQGSTCEPGPGPGPFSSSTSAWLKTNAHTLRTTFLLSPLLLQLALTQEAPQLLSVCYGGCGKPGLPLDAASVEAPTAILLLRDHSALSHPLLYGIPITALID